MSRPGRSDRRRSPSAGRPASASPSPIEASSTARRPRSAAGWTRADALARAGEGERAQAEEGRCEQLCSAAGAEEPGSSPNAAGAHRNPREAACRTSRACAARPKPRTSSSPPASAILCRSASRAVDADRRRGICAARRARRRGDRSSIGRLLVDPPRRGPQQAVHPRHRQFQLQRADAVAGRAIFRRHADRRTAAPIRT